MLLLAAFVRNVRVGTTVVCSTSFFMHILVSSLDSVRFPSLSFLCCWLPFRTNHLEYETNNVGDGKCVICDSFVNLQTLVHICDECNYGSFEGRCVVCGNPGVTDAYYCRECCQMEKDRDGCPKIVNLGSTKTDLFYERKKYGFKKR